MATNKHATIRYHALDRCFSNFMRKYFIEDLVEECNKEIYEYAGIEEGVKKRQVYDDILFMESDQGWAIPLKRFKEGRRVYYRYLDKSFSIKNLGINQTEIEQLKDSLAILTRFKGMPQFEWLEEIQIRLEETFNLKDHSKSFVGFEENPFLKGLNHFTYLFNAIQQGVALDIIYQGFKQVESIQMTIHPWFLKQYNNRWFLFGLNENFKSISNLALDRIIEIKNSNVVYIFNEEIDFDEYFDDVIGVTVKKLSIIHKILLKIDYSLWPYIESKPLHGSQKIKDRSDTFTIVEIETQINYELKSLLFSYMDSIEILEPKSLRESFKNISKSVYYKYI